MDKKTKIIIFASFLFLGFGISCAQAAENNSINWQSIGPGGGGAMTDVAIDPTNDNIVYVATDLAGIFKSVDGGQNFRFIDKGLVNLVVQKIVIDPENTNILYLGTEGGLYKSIDGGENWVLKENGFVKSGGLLNHPIKAIAIDPNNSNILYAGYGIALGNAAVLKTPTYELNSLGKIYKSTDAGETWQVVNTGTSKIETPTFIFEIAVNPNNSSVLFCTTEKGLYKSTDGGVNWQKKSASLPHEDTRGMAINPQNPNIIYVSVVTPPGVAPWQGGIYKSTDEGETWAAKTNGLTKVFNEGNSDFHMNSNYLTIVISSSNPNILYTGDVAYGASGVYKSVDGGENWTQTIVYQHPKFVNISLGIFDGCNVVVFGLAMSSSNPNLVYFSASMTVYKSENGGGTWQKANHTELSSTTVKSNGIENTNLQDIAVNPQNPDIFYFLYADIWLFKSIDGGRTFEKAGRTVNSNPGAFLTSKNDARLLLDPQNPNIIYMSGYLGDYGEAAFVKSVDAATTWDVMGDGSTGFPNSGISSIAIDPTAPVDSRTIYITSSKELGVFKSVDGGRHWSAINNGLGSDLSANKIVIHPTNPNILYLGTNNGFYKSTNAGSTWTKSDSLDVLADVKSIVINPQNPNIMYVATHMTWKPDRNPPFKKGGIFKSTDGGLNWNNINPSAWSNNPVSDQVWVDAFVMDPTNPNILYMGNNDAPYYDNYSKCTLYQTVDGGSTWKVINNNLPNQDGLLSLAIAPSEPGNIFIGLGGSGGFKGIIAGPTFLPADINQDGAINATDFNLLKTDFLKLAASLANPRSDINGDGQATIKDVGILMSGWK